MRLVRRLTVALLAAFVVVLVVRAWFITSEFAQVYESDVARDHRTLTSALSVAIAEVWGESGSEMAEAVVARASAEKLLDVRLLPVVPDPQGPPPALAHVFGRSLAEQAAIGEIDRTRGPHGTLYTYAPVQVEGRIVGVLEVSEPLDDEGKYIRRHLMNALMAGIVLVVVCGLLAWAIGMRFVGQPVARMAAHARRVGRGDLSERIRMQQRDELSDLAEELNRMTDQLEEGRERISRETESRIRALEALRHADRLRTVGSLASGIAHELGTPLNVVSGRAQMIAGGEIESPDEVRATARTIREQTERIVRILRRLLDFARRRGPERVVCDVGKLVREATSLLQPLLQRRGMGVELEVEDGVMLDLDPGQIHQVIVNLVMNAVHASADGATIRLSVFRRQAARQGEAPRACVGIEVRDFGTGMTPDVLAQVFDPFFTTKAVGEGTGLGLSVSWGIVADHGGWIAVESEPGRGSAFTVFLPEPA